MLRHRPCGECGKLVPADTGCKHWNPKTLRSGKQVGWVRKPARRVAPDPNSPEVALAFLGVLDRGVKTRVELADTPTPAQGASDASC